MTSMAMTRQRLELLARFYDGHVLYPDGDLGFRWDDGPGRVHRSTLSSLRDYGFITCETDPDDGTVRYVITEAGRKRYEVSLGWRKPCR